MTKNTRINMPSKKRIFKYWQEDPEGVFKKHGIDIDGIYDCFACGFDSQVQRAHIIAISEGGDNAVSNIHLLCPNCHVESEILSEECYWTWLQNKNTYHYEFSLVRMRNKLSLYGIEDKLNELLKQEKSSEEILTEALMLLAKTKSSVKCASTSVTNFIKKNKDFLKGLGFKG